MRFNRRIELLTTNAHLHYINYCLIGDEIDLWYFPYYARATTMIFPDENVSLTYYVSCLSS